MLNVLGQVIASLERQGHVLEVNQAGELFTIRKGGK